MEIHHPLITNDAVILGILMGLLGLIFYTSTIKEGFWGKFYKYIPALLLCYFLPSVFTSLGIISPYWYDLEAVAAHLISLGHVLPQDWVLADLNVGIAAMELVKDDLKPFLVDSKLYFVASRYFLPAALILLTISISLKELGKLGFKPIAMFLTGTFGVIVGGPLAILACSAIAPDVVGGASPNEVWRGMTTIAGSWIGGGANQAAMFEIFGEEEKGLISGSMYSVMITVDVIVAEIWMAFLLFGVGKADKIDRWLKADSSSVTALKDKMHEFSQKIARIPTMADFIIILGIALVPAAIAHWMADGIAPFISENYPALKKFSLNSHFFWLIVLATTFGIIMSFTKLRNFEGAGASKIGGVFIYFLVATIGMKMNVMEIFDNPAIFLVGLLWMAIHVALMIGMAKLIRAPFFFVAVGSKANIGGAASAPVVAAAFHPSLAPVGVILAVLGYALGTYGAWICGILMQMVAP
ncbi:MAG TPA: hypothetical protein DCX14_09950 [Flavobacteriales bacterium]|nr:hypothetical protein [Flavobacteriales bacterium]